MTQAEIIIAPGRQDIIMTRFFDAPPEAVFRGVTDPTLVPRWWSGGRFATEVETLEIRPGGLWRYIVRDPDSAGEFVFRGVCHAVDAPRRLVQTCEMEGMPAAVQLGVFTFDAADGGTAYREVSVFSSVEQRDAWVQPGMAETMSAGMDLLAEIAREAR
ncbi:MULTISPECIES: SRPBCC domain-containing protein [Actinoalloteichus]|uniref:SRPBCC domain-containing protein n=1 Tax=Actinoalloteichus TaxID=65496 RepID=UPI0009529F8A|nr:MULTISPECIES: SRPBCC domain-containing protein [Actinoalloteichus]